MVFAVWAVRRDFLSRHPELTRHVWKLFQSSIEYCTANLNRIAADASRWEKFPASFLENYFRTLTFGFEDDLRQGLLLFYRLAASAGDDYSEALKHVRRNLRRQLKFHDRSGAFVRSLQMPEVRIDYIVHNVIGFLGYYRFASDTAV